VVVELHKWHYSLTDQDESCQERVIFVEVFYFAVYGSGRAHNNHYLLELSLSEEICPLKVFHSTHIAVVELPLTTLTTRRAETCQEKLIAE
jgi:hypothetical protein